MSFRPIYRTGRELVSVGECSAMRAMISSNIGTCRADHLGLRQGLKEFSSEAFMPEFVAYPTPHAHEPWDLL